MTKNKREVKVKKAGKAESIIAENPSLYELMCFANKTRIIERVDCFEERGEYGHVLATTFLVDTREHKNVILAVDVDIDEAFTEDLEYLVQQFPSLNENYQRAMKQDEAIQEMSRLKREWKEAIAGAEADLQDVYESKIG
jgi:hypothetical protein